MKPAVSVVMPVYNAGPFLEEAVKSILVQSMRDFELIAVDDGSTDRSPQILAGFAGDDSRVRIVSQENGGIVHALNRGIAEANGEFIARMDADDVSLPQRLGRQLAVATTDSRLVVLGGDCDVVDANGAMLRTRVFPSTHAGVLRSLEGGGSGIPHPTAFIRRSAIQRVGGYRERFRHAEDVDLWLRLIEVGEIRSIGEVVLRLRKHSSNVSNLDSGRPQRQAAMAARVCHFRRAHGASDPGAQSAADWEAFRAWLVDQLAAIEEKEAWIGRARLLRASGRRWATFWSLLSPGMLGSVAYYLRVKVERDPTARRVALLSLATFQ